MAEHHIELSLIVNDEPIQVHARNADTLLDVLRNRLGLTGAKPSCENADCGACTVLVNGTPQYACMVLAPEVHGAVITTAEGVQNTPVQEAFVKNWAVQCGYCTPGLIVSTHALARAHPTAGPEVIREWLQPHLCRCLSYEEIENAAQAALGGGAGS